VLRSQVVLLGELARKDLLLFLADRRGALLCFAVPILLASVFGSIFNRGGPGAPGRLPLLLAVEDDSPLTRRVVAALRASDKLDLTETTRAAAVRLLAKQDSGVVLVLPAGFGTRLDLKRPPQGVVPSIQLLHHPASGLQANWAEGLFTEVVLREAATEMLAPVLSGHNTISLQKPFVVERSTVGGPLPAAINSYSHSFCGMCVQYLLFWGLDSGLLLLRERRQGIWRRLRVAPVPLATLLGGKALATALVALAQVAVTFAAGFLLFGVTVTGSPAGFVVLALAAALLSAATGLLVAALGGSEGRARSVAILAILLLSLLGGLWLPSFLLPAWVQRLALALPTTWAVRGLEGVTWQGMAWGGALRCASILLAFSAAFLVVAWWRLAASEQRAAEGIRS
jgi:ABC-2 type transport system permease protein